MAKDKTMITPEDRFNQIIDQIEIRCMANDGPVTPTLKEATEEELSELWQLVNEISPKRKALAKKVLRGEETNDDVKEYLRQQGEDAEVIGKQGKVFVRVLTEKIKFERLLREVVMRTNLALPETGEDLKWFDEGTINQPDLFINICTALKLGGKV